MSRPNNRHPSIFSFKYLSRLFSTSLSDPFPPVWSCNPHDASTMWIICIFATKPRKEICVRPPPKVFDRVAWPSLQTLFFWLRFLNKWPTSTFGQHQHKCERVKPVYVMRPTNSIIHPFQLLVERVHSHEPQCMISKQTLRKWGLLCLLNSTILMLCTNGAIKPGAAGINQTKWIQSWWVCQYFLQCLLMNERPLNVNPLCRPFSATFSICDDFLPLN